jgi:hypothetical protein
LLQCSFWVLSIGGWRKSLPSPFAVNDDDDDDWRDEGARILSLFFSIFCSPSVVRCQ